VDGRRLTVLRPSSTVYGPGIEYAPGPFAGRASEVHPTPSGGVSWCHLLYPLRSFGAPPPFSQKTGEARRGLSCAITGAPVPLTVAICVHLRGRLDEVDFAACSDRLTQTDGSLYGLNNYLSSCCRMAAIIPFPGRLSRIYQRSHTPALPSRTVVLAARTVAGGARELRLLETGNVQFATVGAI
jgi:hypothetical protein